MMIKDYNHFKTSQIKLAKFLRENFPSDVAENKQKPLDESGAVELAIELLIRYKTVRQAVGAYCVACCEECKHGNCSELCEKCNSHL